MKKFYTLLTVLLCLAAVTANAQKYVGGDISLLTQYETHGAKYYDTDKKTAITDLLSYFKSKGMNTMRVRLFVNPDNATAAEKDQGVCQDLEYVKALGKRIKDAGFKLMVDFHYSDTWADPGKQWTPKDWLTLSDKELQEKIYTYTKESLQALKDAGAEPDFIQTGNEISYGMLWGEGIITKNTDETTEYQKSSSTYKNVYAGNTTGNYSANWNRFVALLKKAGTACREVCPNAKIIIHTERVERPSYMSTYYQTLKNDGVDYDIMGLSYYSYYHGNLSTLNSALITLENDLPDKDIMIVEMAYFHKWQPSTITGNYDLSSIYPITDEGQKQYTEALINVLNNHSKVKGLFWWWMEGNECGLDWNTNRVTRSWCNYSLFDNEAGYAMPAINSLRSFLGEVSGVETVETTQVTTDYKWYTVNGQHISKPTQQGIYINNRKKIAVK